ncbi:1-(5-phosphoribosyl)-5-amino-4-imidazole-carboxyl ate carboxylase [Oceanobacillus oncorhynchi subsp. incaldanensis]|uniref:AIR carboxylase n=2 Tax=Oceanobacillus TaxID=182709 RepID=A0A0A1MS72_9BACI|nr:nickel pincer cofactor biosynthesis protein LarB [Oceanobacillus oncorhynchi]MDM8102631.1 nickel pincer cofactor biosynthesis protein LarB [Oceanobacillus oncorhynchi]UUI41098.1 nickel pincer cofactor biosynthesis protein LarB [Oceanobacillus oncorhynchi]GIO21019.1 1-(5-phosphoribosyl)-5-amino-4-imidazole-carboxyl ate carboxylase [Oceanobacillus oncorhynchi subsp. incaldanensis]CEI82554.1 AIR carboxylase [Oceanobacillus oncorhynchi]
MEEILKEVQNGTLSIEDAKKKLATYEDLGFAKVDHHRKQRQGFPEVIYGEGKTVEQIIAILQAIKAKQNDILITRISPDKADKILGVHPELTYHDMAQILSLKVEEKREKKEGYIAILCAGTSDLRIAEEAAVTAEALGSNVRRFYDVGVAGIHRLLDQAPAIQDATVSVVIAGMEGALPSVVGGLVSHPVIAVPTSVGYGANFQGLSALLTMLNSCASGISVVNIDNGFGGAYNAVLIDRLAQGKEE